MGNFIKGSIQAILISSLPFLLPAFVNAAEGEIASFTLHDPSRHLIGKNIRINYSGDESLADLGRRYGVGHLAIGDANLGIDPDDEAGGKEIIIPTSWIIPERMSEGILINLAELRLYFFRKNDNNATNVSTFPIGIGRDGFDTPTGDFEVTLKIKDPAWYPHATTRARKPALPFMVPPGPDNPLGKYWIALSLEGYGIHGTKAPSSIGKKISLGCIRLLEKDLEWLFERAYKGMPVRIINKTVKIAYSGGTPYIEVHRNGMTFPELHREVWQLAGERGLEKINPALLDKIAGQALGIPVPLISK